MFKNLFKHKLDLVFIGAALALIVLLLIIIVSTLRFLVGKINDVSSATLTRPEGITTFNLADLEKIEGLE